MFQLFNTFFVICCSVLGFQKFFAKSDDKIKNQYLAWLCQNPSPTVSRLVSISSLFLDRILSQTEQGPPCPAGWGLINFCKQKKKKRIQPIWINQQGLLISLRFCFWADIKRKHDSILLFFRVLFESLFLIIFQWLISLNSIHLHPHTHSKSLCQFRIL